MWFAFCLEHACSCATLWLCSPLITSYHKNMAVRLQASLRLRQAHEAMATQVSAQQDQTLPGHFPSFEIIPQRAKP